jgi:hypothetical protein
VIQLGGAGVVDQVMQSAKPTPDVGEHGAHGCVVSHVELKVEVAVLHEVGRAPAAAYYLMSEPNVVFDEIAPDAGTAARHQGDGGTTVRRHA